MSWTLPPVPSLDDAARDAARARQDRLTKPPGSLGRLEELSIRLAAITGRPRPALARKTIVVMAADHGVTAEGVSAYPAEVTRQMVLNFLRGGAAINVLARAAGARLVVVNAGLAGPVKAPPGVASVRSDETRWVDAPVAPGTANLARGPAMDRLQAERSIELGLRTVAEELRRGLDVLATGEMGIGNSTAAAAVTAVLTSRPSRDVAGRGTGIDPAGLERKVAAIERAIQVNRPDPSDPLDVLRKVGGLEIGAMAGAIIGAAAARVPVVLDGFISGAAALVAVALAPRARGFLIAAHRSVEPGHQAILELLDIEPLLDFGLRLGEGSGAALVLPILDAAARLLDEMATFEDAGISERAGP